MRERPTIEPSQFLSGWKEIANYLGKGVRTVQRYERHMGLPIRRPAGKSNGSVVATRGELDAWVQASPILGVYSLTNPLPESEYSTRAIRNGLLEMNRLHDQTLALRAEMQKSVESLWNSVHGLQEELRRTWEKRMALRRSVSLIGEEAFFTLQRSEIASEVSPRHRKSN